MFKAGISEESARAAAERLRQLVNRGLAKSGAILGGEWFSCDSFISLFAGQVCCFVTSHLLLSASLLENNRCFLGLIWVGQTAAERLRQLVNRGLAKSGAILGGKWAQLLTFGHKD